MQYLDEARSGLRDLHDHDVKRIRHWLTWQIQDRLDDDSRSCSGNVAFEIFHHGLSTRRGFVHDEWSGARQPGCKRPKGIPHHDHLR